MTEAQDAATVWRCQTEIARLQPAIKELEAEMKGAKARLKKNTGGRQAGNFWVEVESTERAGYEVKPGVVVKLDVRYAPLNLEKAVR